jgi:hypothetical protein
MKVVCCPLVIRGRGFFFINHHSTYWTFLHIFFLIDSFGVSNDLFYIILYLIFELRLHHDSFD